MSSGLKDFVIGGILIGASFLIPGGGFIASALFAYGTSRVLQGVARIRNGAHERIEGVKFNVTSTQAPIPVIYGEMRVGLRVVDTRVIDSTDAATPSADPGAVFTGADDDDVLCRVGAFCLSGENGDGIESITNIRVYFDGKDVVTGVLSFDTPNLQTVGISSAYREHLRYLLADGDDAQTVPQILQDQLGWATTQKGQGIAYGAFFFKFSEETWSQGVPQITALVKGAKVWDPRSSTWVWSDNPALCALDYLTSKRYGGGVPYAARDGGSLDVIDEQSFIDAANYCDNLVSTPEGSQKRFRMNAVVDTSQTVGANIAEMLATCRGDLVWENGKYRLVIRQVTVPEAQPIVEADVVGEIDFVRKGASNVPNLIEATFPDDQSGDFVPNTVSWPLVGDTTFLDEDNGVENRVEIQLPYTTNYWQALQTIMVMLREARNDVMANLTIKQKGYNYRVGEVVSVTHSGPGWTDLEFVVRQVALTPDGLVNLSLQQYSDATYNLDTLAARPSVPTFNLPDAPFRTNIAARFLYERPRSLGVIGGKQRWVRELSWETGPNTKSVEIDPNNYLVTGALDDGLLLPTEVQLGSYHVDSAPGSHVLQNMKLVTRDPAIGDFINVDSHLLLDNTNNGAAQQVSNLDGELNRITFEIQRTGSPVGELVCKVYDDSAGLPGTLLATSYPVPASAPDTGLNDLITFPFPTPGVSLTNGTVYHVAIEYPDGTATDYVGIGANAVASGGGAELLNGAWADDATHDVELYAQLIQGDLQFNQEYDENNLIIGGTGAIAFSLTPFQQGGGLHSLSTAGPATSVAGKPILDYDDIGARFFEVGDRRVDFNGETFGNPGPGPNDLALNDVANGFAFDYVPGEDHDLGQVAMYLKKTGAPTGSAVAKVYADSGGLPGTLLATSDTIDVTGLPTSYDSVDPAANGGFQFSSPASLTQGVLYHVSVEYSGGTATDFISVAAESTGTNDELNGAWAAGVANRQITWRTYARENLERLVRTGSPKLNFEAQLNFSTGELEFNASATGSDGSDHEIGDHLDVSLSALADEEFFVWDAGISAWRNRLLLASDIPSLDASKIGSGTFADARIAQSNVTQHEGALNHDNLLGFLANEHIDWTVTGVEDVHVDRISQAAVTQHEGALNHDNLLGFVADEHVAHSGVSISAGTGLSGGGTIAASRTLNLDIVGLGLDSTHTNLDSIAYHDDGVGVRRILFGSIRLSQLNNDAGFTTGGIDTAGLGLRQAGSTVHVDYDTTANVISDAGNFVGMSVDMALDRLLIYDVSLGAAPRVGYIAPNDLDFAPTSHTHSQLHTSGGALRLDVESLYNRFETYQPITWGDAGPDAAWDAADDAVREGLAVYRYSNPSAGQPAAVNNANFVLNIYSHQIGTSGTGPYGWQISGVDTAKGLYARDVTNGGFGPWHQFAFFETDGSLIIAGNVNDALNFTAAATSDARGISFNGRTAISADSSDGWLRLNQLGEFSNGVYTPNDLRVDGDLFISSTQGIRDVTGSYGTIQTRGGGQGGWEGYSIDGRVVFMHDGSNQAGIYDDVNNQWLIFLGVAGDTSRDVQLRYNGNNRLVTTSAGVTVTGTGTATDWVATSDLRLKREVIDLQPQEAWGMAMGLKPFRFTWADARQPGRQLGFGAQDVLPLIPEVVRYDEDLDQYGMSYEKLVPVLVGAIQHLSGEVDRLRSELALVQA